MTVSTPLDADSRLNQEFVDSNFPYVELSPVKDIRYSELSDIRPSVEADAIQNGPEIFGSVPLEPACLRTSEDNSSSSETGAEEFVLADANPGSPGGLLLVSPANLAQLKNHGAEGEILRQSSQQYADEMDAAQSVWSRPEAIAGFVLMAVLISWILYRRVRRTT